MVLAASAFIVAAVLSCAWVTGQFTTPAVDRTGGYVGELAARDQPWTRLFRTTDALAGLACLAGVALVPRARRQWAGWLAMAVFGAFTIAGSVFPYDCAVLSDAGCGRGPLSPAHHAHVAAAVLSAAAVLAAMALLTRRWHAWGASLITGATFGVTALTLAAVASGRLAGAVQRVQVLLVACWLVYLALRLLIAEPPSRRPRRQHVLAAGAGPAVLVSAGPAGAWFHWELVARELARGHRVTRFDRPGLGLSPASPVPPTLYGEAARLAALAPPHPSQVTVVAGSVAAWHAEAFARLHPLRVSKLVLVNPACERGRRPCGYALGRLRLRVGGPAPRGAVSAGRVLGGRVPGGSAFGRAVGPWMPALGGTWGATALARLTGPAAHRMLTGLADGYGVYRRGRVLAAVAGEWLARREMAADLRRIRAAHPLPDVPVTVISSGRGSRCRARVAGLLDAKLVRLPGCGRHVHLDDPGAITDAV